MLFNVFIPPTLYDERIIISFVSQKRKLKEDVCVAQLRPSSLFCNYTVLNRVGFQTEVLPGLGSLLGSLCSIFDNHLLFVSQKFKVVLISTIVRRN